MTRCRAPAALLVLLLWAASATADWDPGMPAKWVQEPDLTDLGLDVNASNVPRDFILADDFECRQTGPITGIHIWGSWLNDNLPVAGPDNVVFILSIHADIPASQSPTGFSMPGDVLWWREFQPGQFTARPYATDLREGWLTPPDEYIYPGDSICWQYNFEIPEADAFFQQGLPDEPIVYWLDVKAVPEAIDTQFGWKSSEIHWNDDATWGEGIEPFSGPWFELRYPPGHEQQGQSIDLAFVIVGPEQPNELDFGDAPDSPAAPGYPTLLANNGANHVIVPNVFMGASIDPEPDGQPDPNALGDDNDGNDDEDGVVFTSPIYPGANVTVDVTVSVDGYLDTWIDYNINGTWMEANEHVFIAAPVTAGTNNLSFTVPAAAVQGLTFARFRFSTSAVGLPYDGPASDGEVEDYEIEIEPEPQPDLDFGDAPDAAGALGYPTLLANNGARHVIDPAILMGVSIDPEPNGQPDPNALGDDNDGNDDEDGVIFTSAVYPGAVVSVDVTVSANGYLDTWIDYNINGTWMEANEHVFTALPVAAGTNTLNFNVPAAAVQGFTFARFRYTTVAGGLPYVGLAPDGEVEDYRVEIEPEPQTYKWEQRPDLTPNGLDVNASPRPDDYILADDFLCEDSGYVTNIRVWGSWLNDFYPFADQPEAVRFILSIHADIPADQSPTGYSMPGEALWWREFQAGEFLAQIWADNLQEGWLDPPEAYQFPGDTVCWLYEFRIPLAEAFFQTGSPDEPVVYWLDVKAFPEDIEALFGWKSSESHWNDDATWGVGMEPFPGPWSELRYPPGHELQGQSIDLAFTIQSEFVETLDWGDAPDDPTGLPGYPTLAVNNGARHVIVPGLMFGGLIDAEANGQPDANALGDDNNNLDDEDGVTFVTSLVPAKAAKVQITIQGGGFVDAWIDFNGDQSWLEPGDQIITSLNLAAGNHVITFNVPSSATPNIDTFARFRLSSYGGLPPDGLATDGEVEDHRVRIDDKYTLKWIQNPDLSPLGVDVAACPSVAGDDYLLADDFLCTQTGPLTDFHIWGSWLNDLLPMGGDPYAVAFTLSIHADIPADQSPTDYSMPGDLLWIHDFEPEDFDVELYAEQLEEGFMYPPDEYIFVGDRTCWLYKFHVDPHLAFRQRGSETEPVVYWLDLKARPLDPDAQFGWKTSPEHWNDDAVWGLGAEPYGGPWFELRYPPGHELVGASIDLAFALYEDVVTDVPEETPTRFGLRQNVPNPFNPRTEIAYELPVAGGLVKLEIYDVRGRRVRTLVDGPVAGGTHTAVWNGLADDGRALPTGLYFARLRADGKESTVKMVLLR
jgi:hypothetical protein